MLGRVSRCSGGPTARSCTSGGLFYSLLRLYIPNNQWCVGGIKAVPPISHDTLKLQLLRN